jgi:AbrB family looped-hinge helix DNA binding protein
VAGEQKPVPVSECFFGSVTVGERGQIVIPAEARAEMGIQPGDKLLVMRHPIFEGLMIAKFEAIREYYDEFFMQAKLVQSREEDRT